MKLHAMLLLAAIGAATVIVFPAAPAAAKRAPQGFLGVGPSTIPTAAEFQRMKQGGAGSVRFQLSWPAIQPTPSGPFDWSQVDPQVAGAAESGLTMLPFLFGTPAWAGDCSGVNPSVCDRVLPTRSAVGETGWKLFLAEAVKRYGPTGTFWTDTSDQYNPPYSPIRLWQIWNEPNSAEFAPPRPSAISYYRLLQISNAAIKGVDPGASIVLAGLFRPVRNFLTQLYRQAGARDLFDVVALHPYSATLEDLSARLQEARTVMKRAGDRATPLWVTELGWGSAKRGSVRIPLQNLLLGVKGQARMLRQALNLLVATRGRYNLQRVIWFTWKDIPAGAGGRCYLCESAGLFSAGGAPKPSWREFTRIAGGTP
jgi:hypothetical protein